MEMEEKEKTTDGPVPDDESDGWQTMGFVSKARCVLRNVTVEPLMSLFQISSVLTALTTQNLNLQKACRVNLGFDDDVCWALENKNVSSFADEEVRVQQLVSNMLIWQTAVQSAIPCVLVVFIGSWSDRHGKRKPFLILPIIGELVRNAGLVLCVYYFDQLRMEVAGLVESVPSSLAGGITVLYLASFSYIGDVSSKKNRTVRVGLMSLFFGAAWPIGAALSGVLFQKIGFYGVYNVSTSLYLLALFYGLFRITERPNPPEESAATESGRRSGSCAHSVGDFFNLKHITDAFRVTFKRNERKRWVRLYILIVTIVLVHGPTQGESTFGYLYTRVRFNWNEIDFSIYITFYFILMVVGNAFCIGVLSHVLKIDDALIGVISCLSKLLSGIVFALAPTQEFFYFGAMVDILNGSSHVIPRSILSKIVSQDELGQVAAVIAVIETLVPVVYKPLYSTVYKATVNTFPGAFYMFGSIMLTPTLFLYWWMYRINKEEERQNFAVEEAKSKMINESLLK